MKICIITTYNSHPYENSRFFEEASKRSNVDIVFSNYIKYPNFFEDKNLLEYDVYYFFSQAAMKFDAYFLAKELKDMGKIIVNRNMTTVRFFDKSYFYYEFYKNKVPIPKTIKIYSKKEKDKLKELNFPMIAKHIGVHRGFGVNMIRNEEELDKFVEENKMRLGLFLFQEYINYEKDIRIIFIGEPIGGMQRINESFKANISQGGIGKRFELDEELKELSYKLSEIFDMQIFAFDVLVKDSKYYVIDIHRTFQFEGFEKYTNTNVAGKIINYLNEIRN